MKKIIIAVIIISIVSISFFFIRQNTVGGFWTCKENRWIAQGNPDYSRPVIACGVRPTLPQNKNDCLKIGGLWEKQGPDPWETCDRKAVDRGNLCRDSRECEGLCEVELTRDQIRKGMSGKLNIKKKYGQCSVWVVELGCRGIMQKGEVKVICRD